jgi:hypothetical protein
MICFFLIFFNPVYPVNPVKNSYLQRELISSCFKIVYLINRTADMKQEVNRRILSTVDGWQASVLKKSNAWVKKGIEEFDQGNKEIAMGMLVMRGQGMTW